jgi:hypothetical protein
MRSTNTQSFHSELSTPDPALPCLGFTQRTQSLPIHAGLLHGPERAFLIGVVEPPTFPKIARGGGGWNFGTPIAMERYAINPTGNVKPVNHVTGEASGLRGKESVKNCCLLTPAP